MTQTLTQQGTSLALVIDPALLKELQLDATTPLEVKAEAGRIIVTPQRDPARAQTFNASAEKMSQRYEKTLRRLAE